MKCIYCAEEIRDEANVCCHCGRDFYFILPVKERLNSLESKLVEITNSLEHQGKRLNSVSTVFNVKPALLFYYFFASLVIVLVAAGFYKLFHETKSPIFLWFSIFCPFPVGLWLGLVIKGKHLWSYFFTGILSGMVISICVMDIYYNLGAGPPSDSLYTAFISISSATILLTIGGVLGDWIEFYPLTTTRETSFIGKIAIRMIGSPGLPVNSEDHRIKQIENLVKVAPPILIFIGSIITTWLSYYLKSRQ